MPRSSDRSPASSSAPPAKPRPDRPRPWLPVSFEDWLSVLTIAVLALITFVNVVIRYLTSRSFAWTEEISVFLLIVLTLSGAASAFVRHQHIAIEFLAQRGSPARQRRLSLISTWVVLLFFILLTILSIRMVLDDLTWGGTSPAIGVPTWWYSIWLPVLSLLIAIRVAGILVRLYQTRP